MIGTSVFPLDFKDPLT